MKACFVMLLLGLSLLMTGCGRSKTGEGMQDVTTVTQITEQLPEPEHKEEFMEGYVKSLNQGISFSKISDTCYKSELCTNPISGTVFCADPTAVEYEGRLYVYGTNDHQQYDAVGDDGKNTYEKIKSFVIFSTEDMMNWTYHGKIDTAAVAPWIISSWAPSITSRVEADGKTHFYLYFSNSGCGVGVITATSPVGPWSDPLGKPLIDGSTPGLKNCPNPFDPGVCIEDNGTGWLSFGGGVAPNGTDAMPGVARIVQLGDDMLSLASEIVEIKAPYFFEASELNYINGTYVYTYNNNWVARSEWNYEDVTRPMQCSMAYMTTKTPLDTDSWVYRGDYFPNPGDCGMDYSNNHTHLQKYQGKYYLFHHTMLKQSRMTTEGGFRSLGVITLPVDEEQVSFKRTKTSAIGNLVQIKCIDPKLPCEGETAFTSAGMGYEYEGDLVKAAKALEEGAWIYLRDVDFNSGELAYFCATVKGTGRLELRLDNKTAGAAAFLEFDSTEYQKVYMELQQQITGVHDVYLVMSQEGICLDCWSFK